MDSFSQRQLRIPRLARDVYLIGSGVDETRIEASASADRCVAALDAACTGVAGERGGLVPYVEGLLLGRPEPEAEEDETVLERLGLAPLPAPGATGEGSALEMGCWAVASGAADVLVVLAWNAARAGCLVLGEAEMAHTLHRVPVRIHAASGSQSRFPGATEGIPPLFDEGDGSTLDPALRWAARRACAQAGITDPGEQLDAAYGVPTHPSATNFRLEIRTPLLAPMEGGFFGILTTALDEIRAGDAGKVLCVASEEEGTRTAAAVVG